MSAPSKEDAGASLGSAVSIARLSKRFGMALVLDDVSLEVRKGEFLSLLGPSGCGKTTLLRIIAGFEQPTAGSVLIGGKDVAGVAPYERNTNMIFQQLALFPHMTVYDNIAFGLQMKKTGAAQIRHRVQEALSLVQMDDYGGRLPDQLSGGQRQRVAMARAIVNDPAVLLLDEPLGALDLQLRLQLQVELRRLHRSLGNTFIFVTHDQTEAMTMSDRIAVLDRGRIVQLGSPQEIYETPRTRFVANFVGHTNLFDGTVTAVHQGDRCTVSLRDGTVEMTASCAEKRTHGEAVAVALRFERVSLSPAATGAGATPGTGFGGIVKERTYMGGFLRFVIATDWRGEITADTPITNESKVLAEGDRVWVYWRAEDAHAIAA